MLQKRILEFVYIQKRSDINEDIFADTKIPSVYELHIHELLKFVSISINNFQSDEFLNSMFTLQNNSSSTRSSCLNLLKVPNSKQKFNVHLLNFDQLFCIRK